jgi:hypothetical protein
LEAIQWPFVLQFADAAGHTYAAGDSLRDQKANAYRLSLNYHSRIEASSFVSIKRDPFFFFHDLIW